jgi:hypothetical protein
MKTFSKIAGGIAFLFVICARLSAEPMHPGQIDFGPFMPASGGEFVEINLSSTLISLAARLVDKSEPEVAQLLSGLKLVRANVIGLNDENRADIEKRSQKIRKELDSKGWERVVTAQKPEQDVAIYLKTQDKDTIQGIVILVSEPKKQAVFINIVGDVKPEQLTLLGERLHIDPLKNVGRSTQKQSDKGEAKEDDSNGHDSTK